jgi:ketosteroid isomerase-like protein
MDAAVVKGCESFSEGKLEPCLPHLDANVTWEVVSQDVIVGVDAVREFCAEMMKNGCPSFQNQSVTVGADAVAIEGRELHGTVRYCDVYHIREGKIGAINSYCICPGNDD